LSQFLENLNIKDEDENNNFGDVEKLIKDTFTRQLYLKRCKVEIEGAEPLMQLMWGERALKEFDKKAVLQQVASIMKKPTTSFAKQYHEVHQTMEEPVDLIND
jgi:MAGE family